MCGIVAIYAMRGRIPEDALERATRRLTHRGPDGQRTWVSADGRVGLGHARLSIIDLATGDQPIASEDERLHIVVNGEFYDFERIQDELTRRGHRLRTRSDSEIALHLYEEHGTGCLEQLRGEFAFILWDGRTEQLFAARDRFGIKPLYYAWRGDVLVLASEAKALFAAGIPARWDRYSVLPGRPPPCAAAGPHALRGRASGPAGALPDRLGRSRSGWSATGISTIRRPTGPDRARAGCRACRRVPRRRSMRRSASGSAPTCRSAAT